MIKPSQFTQQMIDLHKVSFLSLCNAASTMQKQASSAMDLMLNQATWIPSEGRQAITDWLGTCQEEGERFKSYVEKSYANLGMYFSPKAVTKTTKAAKVKKAPAVKPKKVAAQPAKKEPAEPAAQVAPEQVKKVTAEPAKKAAAEPAKKAAPEVTKKKAAIEAKPSNTAATKKAGALQKDSKAVLK